MRASYPASHLVCSASKHIATSLCERDHPVAQARRLLRLRMQGACATSKPQSMPIYFILTLAFLNGTSEQAARVMLWRNALIMGTGGVLSRPKKPK